MIALLPPLGVLAAKCIGIEYALTRATAYAATLAVCFAAALFLTRNKRRSRLFVLLFPICFADGILLIPQPETRWRSLIVIVMTIEALALGWNVISMNAWKYVYRIVCTLLALLLCFLALAGFIMYDFATEDNLSLISPDGTQIAELRIMDEGALGGDTFLTARSTTPDLQLLFGRFRARSAELFRGEWIPPEEVNLFWTNDGRISYNGITYETGGKP